MSFSQLIDVSLYQGPQDWKALKASGIDGAFAKASEGQHSRDSAFAGHIKGIKASGMVPGAYHFAWPNQDVAAEASNYIDAVKSYAGTGFTHWLDLESYSDGRNYKGRSAAQIKAWATKWVSLVHAAFPGQRVGVYTSASDIAAGHLPDGVPLWYPAYPGTSCDTYSEAQAHSRPEPSGHAVTLWQFTSKDPNGKHIDRSIAYMSPDALHTWAGSVAPTKPVVDISNVIAARAKDLPAATGHTTYKSDVIIVERALHAEGLLAAQWVDGSWGSKTQEAFDNFRRRVLKLSGSDATGAPGKYSLTALGKRHGFTTKG